MAVRLGTGSVMSYDSLSSRLDGSVATLQPDDEPAEEDEEDALLSSKPTNSDVRIEADERDEVACSAGDHRKRRWCSQ